jgi:hypothetical protein
VERGDHIVSYRPEDLLDELDGLDADTLLAQARQVVAQGVVGEPITAADPVNVPMIRHYCQALGDDNPVYLDDQVAAGHPSRRAGRSARDAGGLDDGAGAQRRRSA